ncbi:MAG: hypothetical protein M3Q08_00185 [Pseudomonadota bacterium]|nr:hypothetical protein [Pseudomonadota bacterium]
MPVSRGTAKWPKGGSINFGIAPPLKSREASSKAPAVTHESGQGEAGPAPPSQR